MPIIKHGYRGRADYGHKHQQTRARLLPYVELGMYMCARCRKRILPGQPWDLDHNETRTGYLGPSHRHCNRAAR